MRTSSDRILTTHTGSLPRPKAVLDKLMAIGLGVKPETLDFDAACSEAVRDVVAKQVETGIDIVSVNPSSVQGPGRATGTGKIILDLARGKLPFLVDTRLSIVDIDDCARGHIAAAARGVPGERYILNSSSMTMPEAVALLQSAIGRDLPVRFLPGWMASVGGAGVEGVARVTRRHPPVCREMVRTLRHGHTYDGSKAELRLGVSYTSTEDLLGRLVAWFRSEDLIDG